MRQRKCMSTCAGRHDEVQRFRTGWPSTFVGNPRHCRIVAVPTTGVSKGATCFSSLGRRRLPGPAWPARLQLSNLMWTTEHFVMEDSACLKLRVSSKPNCRHRCLHSDARSRVSASMLKLRQERAPYQASRYVDNASGEMEGPRSHASVPKNKGFRQELYT